MTMAYKERNSKAHWLGYPSEALPSNTHNRRCFMLLFFDRENHPRIISKCWSIISPLTIIITLADLNFEQKMITFCH